ncbi:MAG TPA: hypothetical protein VEB66_01925 [Opitutaceae bacterium]|nr:hypothetical protein [Opitutaceae bacterium]
MIASRPSLLRPLVLAASLVLVGAVAAQVVPPNRRAAAVEAAQNLIAARDTALPANLVDPFHPVGFGASEAPADPQGNEPAPDPANRSGPRTDRELLAAIAAAIRAPNVITLGGQQILVFGQRRVKAGDTLTISFEGTDYTLTVTAIDRTSFTLRLNREEYTRPIK